MKGSIKMVRRVGGIMGELGRGPKVLPKDGERLDVEVLSVGPLFQELDLRWLYLDIQKPQFYKAMPI